MWSGRVTLLSALANACASERLPTSLLGWMKRSPVVFQNDVHVLLAFNVSTPLYGLHVTCPLATATARGKS